MSRIRLGICALVLVPLIACSESTPAGSTANERAPAATSSPGGNDSTCTILAAATGYGEVPALGPDFSGSTLDIFVPEGTDPIAYASKPEAIAGYRPVQLAYVLNDQDELELTLCFPATEGIRESAHAGPVGSQGGQHAIVHSMFMASADKDPEQELVILVGWSMDGALDTSGTLYEPHVFDVAGADGKFTKVALDDQELLSGFEGTREGAPVTYPFKDEQAFRARLQALGF